MTTCKNDDTAIACAPERPAVSYTKPNYRAIRNDQGYHLQVDVPGTSKTGITLNLSQEVLTITAQRSDTIPDSWKTIAQELPSTDYQLRLRIDVKIDPDAITAKLENGVLQVDLPLKEASKARTIKIG